MQYVKNKDAKGKRAINLDDAIKEVCKYVTKSESWLDIPDSHLVEIAEVRRWPRLFEVLGAARDAEQLAQTVTTAVEDAGARAGQPAQRILDTPVISDGDDILKRKARAPNLMDLPARMPMDKWIGLLELKLARDRAVRRLQLANKYPLARFRTLDGDRFSYTDLEELKEKAIATMQEWRDAWRDSETAFPNYDGMDIENDDHVCYHCEGLLTNKGYCKSCGWTVIYE